MIPITKPFLPPKNEYKNLISKIWESEWLTNDGPLVRELEKQLSLYLNIPHLLYVSNGTIALQIAIKAIGLKGEIITTPFSYVATTSTIVWEGCKPVFVDIDPASCNINHHLIEDAITEKTTAILATHVFGNPCNIEGIRAIADKYGLKVIYDAAHCFGTTYKGDSIFNRGDISTASFHATKLFHTTEGGAIFTGDEELYERMRYMRNFGHDGPGNFNGVGINGKNSEFHAAMGILNLRYFDQVAKKRKQQSELYDKLLADLNIQVPKFHRNTVKNYSYYPILLETEDILLEIKSALEENEIYPRRYFYPGLNQLDYVTSGQVPVSEKISETTLCLPLYHDLKNEEIEKICTIITSIFSKNLSAVNH